MGHSHGMPLHPATYMVLVVLAGGTLHGYGIAREVAERSSGRLRLEPGNLYRTLGRLVESGLVEPAGMGESEGGGEKRRYYRITSEGLTVVSAETERLRRLVSEADAALSNGGRPR